VAGPLQGFRLIEMAGIGPGPFAAMLLADMGAEVIRVDRAQAVAGGDHPVPHGDVLGRGRRSIGLDLKQPAAVDAVLRLVEGADAIIEGFRPGVMERLGLGPDVCLARNPRLVYGRMTGWGQEGPYALAAGHDINYISLAGALAHFGRSDSGPVPPLNMVGDFGGGGMFLAFGVVAALLEVSRSGQGQVVDAAMIDGAATLMSMFWGFRNIAGFYDEQKRGTNMLDTGAHYYDVYQCADGEYVSVGTVESQFYAELLRRLGLDDDPDFAVQNDRSRWPELKERLRTLFLTRTRDEWCALLEYSDACFAPVLTMPEAAAHPHMQARKVIVERDGVLQPAPAPRFSRTTPELGRPPSRPGDHTREILTEAGLDAAAIDALLASGAAR
jgi:alpha-methylacyl-CoA racemase